MNEDLTLDGVIRRHVKSILREHNPNEACRILGIARTTLYRWRKKWKLPAYEWTKETNASPAKRSKL